jgi:hypothetical protein
MCLVFSPLFVTLMSESIVESKGDGMAERQSIWGWIGKRWPVLVMGGIGLVLVVFPFDWLANVWPGYAQIFDRVFVTARDHAVGHTTLFCLVGLIVQGIFPSLRSRPLLFAGLMLLGALVQESVQSISNHELQQLSDLRDFGFDLLGITLALVIGWGVRKILSGSRWGGNSDRQQ